jgi:cell division protein ZipA
LAQLRWILAALGVVAIAAIWWWSTRRSGQAPGNSELRESTVLPVQSLAPMAEARERASADRQEPADSAEPRMDVRERSIAPLEPLSIRTADFERVPILDLPMMADREREHGRLEDADYPESSMRGLSSDPFSIGGEPVAAPYPAPEPPVPLEPPSPAESPPPAEPTGSHPAEPVPPPPFTPRAVVTSHRASVTPGITAAAPAQAPLHPGVATENSDRLAAVEPSPPNLSEQQKIVTLRVCAVGEERWSGRDLMAVLEGLGLAYGRYQVYHRKHADGRSIFCVASLIEPGTFDAARMPEQEFRGVSLFAVLPGPAEPLQAVDALLTTARELARDLSGTIQDSKGMPFSPQRIATLREDVARFQSVLQSPARDSAARGPAA